MDLFRRHTRAHTVALALGLALSLSVIGAAQNSAEDGFAGTAPVCSFPVNGYGLCDMAGNVWQWVSDWYRPDYYRMLADKGGVVKNPQGPSDSSADPGAKKRVQKRGSFLCTDQYCMRYCPGARGKGSGHRSLECRVSVSEVPLERRARLSGVIRHYYEATEPRP